MVRMINISDDIAEEITLETLKETYYMLTNNPLEEEIANFSCIPEVEEILTTATREALKLIIAWYSCGGKWEECSIPEQVEIVEKYIKDINKNKLDGNV